MGRGFLRLYWRQVDTDYFRLCVYFTEILLELSAAAPMTPLREIITKALIYYVSPLLLSLSLPNIGGYKPDSRACATIQHSVRLLHWRSMELSTEEEQTEMMSLLV